MAHNIIVIYHFLCSCTKYSLCMARDLFQKYNIYDSLMSRSVGSISNILLEKLRSSGGADVSIGTANSHSDAPFRRTVGPVPLPGFRKLNKPWHADRHRQANKEYRLIRGRCCVCGFGSRVSLIKRHSRPFIVTVEDRQLF